MAGCKPTRYYLTLPRGALPFRYDNVIERAFAGESIPTVNGLLFPNRHTYMLSTLEYKGELEWFIVNGIDNAFNPAIDDGDSIITERAVYQRGVSTVMLKPIEQQWSLSVIIDADNECELNMIRKRYLAHMLSVDLATSLPVDLEVHVTGHPYDTPFPWTITEEVCIDGVYTFYHRDVSMLWLDNDNIVDGRRMEANLVMVSETDTWYGNEVTDLVFMNEDTGTPIVPASDLDQPKMHFGVPNIYYNGTARTPMFIRGTVNAPGTSDTEILSIALVDLSYTDLVAERWVRFKHENWPTGGWLLADGVVINLDAFNRQLYVVSGGTTTYGLEHQAAADSLRDWPRFQFQPGHLYQIVFETNKPGTVVFPGDIQVVYNPRYAGI